MATYYLHLDSPVGPLLLVAGSDGRLTGLHTDGRRHGPEVAPDWKRDPSPFSAACDQLGEYFAGERTEFDLALDPHGTPFQQSVWSQLLLVPYGETSTYGQIAQRIGRPGAQRAVGHANARNPIGIVVPCHRVVGTGGSLTGYAGGLDRKEFLLGLEAQVCLRRRPQARLATA